MSTNYYRPPILNGIKKSCEISTIQCWDMYSMGKTMEELYVEARDIIILPLKAQNIISHLKGKTNVNNWNVILDLFRNSEIGMGNDYFKSGGTLSSPSSVDSNVLDNNLR